MLAPVYPGQVLQIGLCTPCDDNIFNLYAKTHDSLKTHFLCRISNQAEMLNFISHHANLINYIILNNCFRNVQTVSNNVFSCTTIA